MHIHTKQKQTFRFVITDFKGKICIIYSYLLVIFFLSVLNKLTAFVFILKMWFFPFTNERWR